MKKNIMPILLVLGLIFSLYALTLGSTEFTIKEVFLGLFGKGEEQIVVIIREMRLPRIIMALLIGMMLASSGTVVQSLFQNPLADPYIIGISASATFGAVLAYILKLPSLYYGIFAFICSLISSFIIFNLTGMKGRLNISTLLIMGIAISSLLGAFTSFAMYFIGEDSFKIIMWTMGYLGDANWEKVKILSLPLIISVAYFYSLRHELDALLNGDEEAHSLGVNVERVKRNLLIISSLIVAFSVAFSGMIGFVGLIVPHTLRLIVGSSNNKLLPIVTLAGGVFLLFCDTIARVILAPIELPIGIVSAFLGAPFFIYLAFKSRKEM
jgi:ABC-type Fe3+-siderophore transport system, permease component